MTLIEARILAAVIDKVILELVHVRDLPNEEVTDYVEQCIQDVIIQLKALREGTLKP
jgi:hypothetical protein